MVIIEKIVDTIEFADATTDKDNYSEILGKWKSLDDEKSVIEFKDQNKIDYYDGEKQFEDKFGLYDNHPTTDVSVDDSGGKYLIVGSGEDRFDYVIVELTDSKLTLMYLPRGNLLRYEKME